MFIQKEKKALGELAEARTHAVEQNAAGIDIPLETISTIEISDDYQSTGIISLVPQVNLKKKLRTWKFNTIRDNTTNRPRFRDKAFQVVITFNNIANYRLVLHDVISNFNLEVL